LYKLYYKAMYNTSLRIVNNSAEAEDIMQESFLTAFQKIDNYAGDSTFGAWLKKIVVNKSIDAYNKRKEEFVDLDAIVREDSPKESFRTFGDVQVNEETESEGEIQYEVEEIVKAMDLLPNGYRVVLSLYLLEGYDHEEIAQILNISSATSRSQYNRAKNKLRELIKIKNER